MGAAPSGRSSWAGALLCCAGCLAPNHDFDGESTGSSGTPGPGETGSSAPASTGDTSTSEAGSTSEATCSPDGFEPDDMHPQIGLGTLSLVLETADAIDRFHLFVPIEAPKVVQAVVDGASLRVCTYMRCSDGGMPTMLECTEGLSGADPDGAQGCCGDTAVAMSFACGSDGSGKVLIEVDGGAQDCVYYGLTVSQDGG